MHADPTDTLPMRTAMGLIALAGSLVALLSPLAVGQGQETKHAGEALLPISNDRFSASGIAEQPVADWTFESLSLDVNPDDFSSTVRISPKGDATVVVPTDGAGVVLEGTTDLARGDLVSSPCPLKPFRWVKVGVEYVIESGDPLAFVCLRPTKDRALVDLEFLPKTAPGEKRKAFVRLHTGSLDGEYSLAVSILGTGSVRFLVVKAKDDGEYPRPTKPAVVIDLMHVRPATEGPHRWNEIYKLETVYGFPAIEFISYTDVTPAKLKTLDPALILLWPYADREQNPDRQKLIAATRAAARHGAPLIGTGLGHQVLAQVEKNVAMDRETEVGPTRLDIVVDDPVFAGLPRRSHFLAEESHRSIVREVPPGAEIIASSEAVMTQAFRYPGKPWYTFQANLERGWEIACPEACIVWKNMLRGWGLAPPAEKR